MPHAQDELDVRLRDAAGDIRAIAEATPLVPPAAARPSRLRALVPSLCAAALIALAIPAVVVLMRPPAVELAAGAGLSAPWAVSEVALADTGVADSLSISDATRAADGSLVAAGSAHFTDPVRSSEPVLWHSTDGTSWSARALLADSGGAYRVAVDGDRTWVVGAVDDSPGDGYRARPAVWMVEDGDVVTALPDVEQIGGGVLVDVATDGDVAVVVGSMSTSPDPAPGNARPDGVATPQRSLAWRTDDAGRTWTPIDGLHGTDGSELHGVVRTSDAWVIAGRGDGGASVWQTADDAATTGWERRDPPGVAERGTELVADGTHLWLHAATDVVADPEADAVRTDEELWRMPEDGGPWEAVALPADREGLGVERLRTVGDEVVLLGRQADAAVLWRLDDGAWVRTPLATPATANGDLGPHVTSVVGAGDDLVALGWMHVRPDENLPIVVPLRWDP